MAAYVIVWENNTFGHSKVSGHTWPGHSSLNIGDLVDRDEFEVNAFNSYVSWWPENSANFSVRGVIKSAFKKAQKGSTSTFCNDIQSETYLPDHIVKLTTSAEQENQMKAEWLTVKMKAGGSSYKNLRKNCSTIVARCLHAAGFYALKWAVDNNFAWSPADVYRLAVKAGGTSILWAEFEQRLQASGITEADYGNITTARSGRFCTIGVPCEYQNQG